MVQTITDEEWFRTHGVASIPKKRVTANAKPCPTKTAKRDGTEEENKAAAKNLEREFVYDGLFLSGIMMAFFLIDLWMMIMVTKDQQDTWVYALFPICFWPYFYWYLRGKGKRAAPGFAVWLCKRMANATLPICSVICPTISHLIWTWLYRHESHFNKGIHAGNVLFLGLKPSTSFMKNWFQHFFACQSLGIIFLWILFVWFFREEEKRKSLVGETAKTMRKTDFWNYATTIGFSACAIFSISIMVNSSQMELLDTDPLTRDYKAYKNCVLNFNETQKGQAIWPNGTSFPLDPEYFQQTKHIYKITKSTKQQLKAYGYEEKDFHDVLFSDEVYISYVARGICAKTSETMLYKKQLKDAFRQLNGHARCKLNMLWRENDGGGGQDFAVALTQWSKTTFSWLSTIGIHGPEFAIKKFADQYTTSGFGWAVERSGEGIASFFQIGPLFATNNVEKDTCETFQDGHGIHQGSTSHLREFVVQNQRTHALVAITCFRVMAYVALYFNECYSIDLGRKWDFKRVCRDYLEYLMVMGWFWISMVILNFAVWHVVNCIITVLNTFGSWCAYLFLCHKRGLQKGENPVAEPTPTECQNKDKKQKKKTTKIKQEA